MFDKVSGSDYIRINFSKNHIFDEIKSFFEKDENAFRKKSKIYYQY
jgi:uncharacterized protein YbbC (DUF1343 family)